MTIIIVSLLIAWIVFSALLVLALCRNSRRITSIEEERDYHDLEY